MDGWRSRSYLHCGCSSVISETRGGGCSTWPDPAVMVMWEQQGFSSLGDGDVWDGERSPSASQEMSTACSGVNLGLRPHKLLSGDLSPVWHVQYESLDKSLCCKAPL